MKLLHLLQPALPVQLLASGGSRGLRPLENLPAAPSELGEPRNGWMLRRESTHARRDAQDDVVVLQDYHASFITTGRCSRGVR